MIHTCLPYLPPIEKYIQKLKLIYDNHHLTNFGPLSLELEERLKKYLDVPYLLLVSNGTIALQIAIRLLGWKDKKVITTPYSFVATTNSLLWENAKPNFADINLNSLTIDADKIQAILEKDSTISGILPVHTYGIPCDVEKIQAVSKKHNVPVLYDAAHAFNVKYKDKSILHWGDISILSFHATKIFHSTEGGALIFKTQALYEKAKRMINFGIDTKDGEIKELGINGKMSDFHAGMGLCVLDDIPDITQARKNIWQTYCNKLPKNLQTIEPTKTISWNYAYFPILLPSETILLRMMNKFKDNEIIARRYFYPSLENLSYLAHADTINCPNAYNISKRILCLPIYHGLSEDSQKTIIECILDTLGQR